MSMGQWLPSFSPLSTAHLTTNYLGPPQDEASPTDLQPLLSCAARVNGLPLVARFTVPVLVKRVFNYFRPVPLYLLRLKVTLAAQLPLPLSAPLPKNHSACDHPVLQRALHPFTARV